MGKIEKFEDLRVWKESMELAAKVHELLKETRNFSLRDQIQRSLVSIPSSISEGFERQTNKEFIQYLYIAKGSCGELRTQLHIAEMADMIKKNVVEELIENTRKISGMLYKLIDTRKKNF